jgi:hypothetical protein
MAMAQVRTDLGQQLSPAERVGAGSDLLAEVKGEGAVPRAANAGVGADLVVPAGRPKNVMDNGGNR